VLVAIAVGALIILGWVKPYLSGPDLALTSLYRPKPVHVEVETVKWLTKTKTVKERVEIPIEVIREVPVKVEKKLDEDFGIKLLDLKAQNRELVDILAVPRAPRGGEMAVTVSTATGRIDGIFRAHPAPLIELGGLREVGLDYDPLNSTATGYYRQDLLRLGPAIVNAKAFAGVPLAPGKSANVGVMVGVAVRF
jgi:hypothetical protein